MRATIYLLALLGAAGISAEERIPLVEPRIGTAPAVTATAGIYGKGSEEHGQTMPAVFSPHGMNSWTPQTRATERKCIAPYYYDDTLFRGFRNSHWINGGCTQDYGSVSIISLPASRLKDSQEDFCARFSYDSEISRPDYYSVSLPDDGIRAELTGTSHAGIFRFTYDDDSEKVIILTPLSDEAMGSVKIDPAHRRIIAENPVHRIYQGKGEPAGFSGHYAMQWPENLDICGYGVIIDGNLHEGEAEASGKDVAAYIRFRQAKDAREVVVKAGSSFTDAAGASQNLSAEIPDFDFDRVRSDLANVWERHLNKLSPPECSREDSVKFFSALYRTAFLPREFSDVDGRYPSFAGGKEIKRMEPGHIYYEDYSLWDTYRAQMPLLREIEPERYGDMMNSLVLKAEQGGWLPIFPCWNSYTAAMIGDHAAAVLAEAIVAGVKGFDHEKAYQYMRKNAFETPSDPQEYADGKGRRALDSYIKYGYIPLEDTVAYAYHKREQTSRTLEYAYDDYAVAQAAKKLGHIKDYEELMRRSQNWRNVFNDSTGYVAGRYADGNFAPCADPKALAPYITEGAPCHYTWYVPHDLAGLIEAMGGRERFIERLDELFDSGAYWHGNEPCHQIAWMYAAAGRPDLGMNRIRHIMDTEYLAAPGGLSGNEDAGQMSAWYIYAALGRYPICPVDYTVEN